MPVRETSRKKRETAKTEGKRVVKKLALSERVNKLLEKVEGNPTEKIWEMQESVLSGEESNKNNVVFVVFTDKSKKEVDLEENKQVIKDVLFHLTVNEEGEKSKNGKSLVIDILSPEQDGEPHLLCFQELQDLANDQ